MGPEQEQHPCRHRRSPRSPSCSGGRGGLAAPRPHIPSCSGGPRDRHRHRPLCSRSSHGGTTSSGGSRRRSSPGLEVAAVVASAQIEPHMGPKVPRACAKKEPAVDVRFPVKTQGEEPIQRIGLGRFLRTEQPNMQRFLRNRMMVLEA